MEGRGIQVMHVRDDNSHQDEDEELLRSILLRDEIKDLPVVVVSVAGAFRGGKSFLLNYFLKYLMAPQRSRLDGSWIGRDGDDVPHTGFNWRGGRERDTTGIVMWSEPIVTTLASGVTAAVILMDTQGTFDLSSSVNDFTKIFALSTLLASVQIYNVSMKIGGDDLQNLQLFAAYGRLLHTRHGTKAFQLLTFLVRDWPNNSEIPFGFSTQYLEEVLQTSSESTDTVQEIQDIREHIRESFQSVSCFLMPHPGFGFEQPGFNGQNKDMRPIFLSYVKELTAKLLAPENLILKTINGETVTASELYTYFTRYMRAFNSAGVPPTGTIYRATVESSLHEASEEARRVYRTGMESDCGSDQPSVPAQDLSTLHTTYLNGAVEAYNNKMKMGSDDEIAACLANVREELEARLQHYDEMNIGKVQRAITAAKEVYDSRFENVMGEQILCVHRLVLEQTHREGLQEAVALFDQRRRRINTEEEDLERTNFIEGFERQYRVLVRTNEQNNNGAVAELSLEYWRTVSARCHSQIPFSESQLLALHLQTKDEALRQFANRRSHPDTQDEDNFKNNLVEMIEHHYNQMKAINQSRNSNLISAGVEAYDTYMRSAWNPGRVCLHPADLEAEHRRATRRALRALNGRDGDEIDAADETEVALGEILAQRYNTQKTDNKYSNETGIAAALHEYRSHMEYCCSFSVTWVTGLPYLWNVSSRYEYHLEAKKKAHREFYRRRRDQDNSAPDEFFDQLESYLERARDEFRPTDFWEDWPTYETDLILG